MDGQRGRCGPYAAQYVQHSLTGTVQQSSTRGLSSHVHHSPFASSPITSLVLPFLSHHSPPFSLTFYHHNRYIIPRSVFYSRVTPWNAFVRDIVPPPPPLSFPPSSPFFHPLRFLSDQRELFFLFGTVHFFGFMASELLESILRIRIK